MKRSGKKILIIPAVIIALLIALLLTGGKETILNAAAKDVMEGYEESYKDYLTENGYDGSMASSVIDVPLDSFTAEGDIKCEKGENGLLTEGNGSVTLNFRAEEEGFYNLLIDYIALPGTTSDIQRKIYIDGETPYSDLDQIVIRRMWSDDKINIKNHNELRPKAYELYDKVSWYAEDKNRRNNEPLKFFLSKGKHTITFETVKEPLEFAGLSFRSEQKPQNYEEAFAELKKQFKEYDGSILVLQAERCEGGTKAIKKSSSYISVVKNHSDSKVVPFHPYYNRYNTIGGQTWENPGDSIAWTVEVPEEGLYCLTFKGRQSTNRGVTSYRRLYINGSVPYSEMNAIGFDYSPEMNNYTVTDKNGDPCLFHLVKGENEIVLENVMGPFGEIITEVEQSMKNLNDDYLRVIRLTGQAPDRYIDYQIADKVEGFRDSMKTESERLNRIIDEIVEITGEKGENTALLEKMAIEAEGLYKDPEKIVRELNQFKNNVSAIGTWLVTVEQMPLELDSITLSAEGEKLPDPRESGWAAFTNGTLRFFASFFIKSGDVGTAEASDPLTVWVASYGKEQAQIMQNLSDDYFTPDSNIPVRIQLIPVDVVLRAALAGNGPDVVIGLSQSTLQDFAMRDATLDLSKLDGYKEATAPFPKSTLDTASYNGGVYGLPETANFMMIFYRKDILGELGVEVPETWDDFIKMLPILQQNNYGAFVPNAYINDGSGNLNFYLSMVSQYGGDVYEGEGNDYGIRSGLGSTPAMEAFKDYTDFYTNYGMEKQIDFSNRFRTGEIPVGIVNYTTFCTLEIFAPEIKGEWSFAPVPGVMKDDGTVDNTVIVDTVDTVIMKQTDMPDAAWRFVKWWMQSDTQLSYCQNVESIMGSAARVASANPDVIKQLPWSDSELTALLSQLQSTKGIPAVPGYYMTARMVSYSYSDVVTNNSNPRETLYLNIKSIDNELKRKRTELIEK